MKVNIFVIDPPYQFSDRLVMSDVKRGAESQYNGILTADDIINLDIKSIAADDALCALWVPSTHLQLGLDCLKAWGFNHKQTVIWVKVKKFPLKFLIKDIFAIRKNIKDFRKNLTSILQEFDLNNILAFYMGHYFRQTHEVVLIGARGKIASKVKNKSIRSVFFAPIGEHSEKPEIFQDMLEKMFKGNKNFKYVELFARRDRQGWITAGNECPSTYGQDIRESIEKIKQL